jgi:hypothetical protein
MKSCLKAAEKKILPSVWAKEDELHDPESLNLLLNKNGIDPFNQFSQLPRMIYLNEPLVKQEKQEEEDEGGKD